VQFGGTMALLDFVRCVHAPSMQTAIDRTDTNRKGACCRDYGFHLRPLA
jgi:hypothetical protein